MVLDWIIVAVVVGFAIRGWRRGAAREAIDLVLIVVGILLVFRLAGPLGLVVEGMANVSSELARIIAAVVILLIVGIGSFFLGRVVAGVLKVVPGATTANRLAGAGVGVAFAAVLVVLSLTVLTAAPLPSGMRSAWDGASDESLVAEWTMDSNGVVQSFVSVATGEQVLSAAIGVREAVGDRLAAGTIPIPLPGVGEEALVPSQSAAQYAFDELNRVRIEEGVDPLAWSPDLAIVAVARASDVYRSGWLRLDDGLGSALVAAGVPGTIHTDLVVLAASPDGVVEAVESAAAYRSIVTDGTYRKAGIGVVEGPFGLVAVQVLSG